MKRLLLRLLWGRLMTVGVMCTELSDLCRLQLTLTSGPRREKVKVKMERIRKIPQSSHGKWGLPLSLMTRR